MRRASRARELLAFDLALGEAPRGPAVARPCDAPSLFSAADPSLQRLTLVGFDEAGRGALAGPVVVGCVQIPRELLADAERVEELLGGVDDSKALTPKARDVAFASIVSCTRWASGCASASEVDAVGIVAAAQRAALRAYRRLGATCELAVFDRGLSLGEPVPLDPEFVVRDLQCAVSDSRTIAPRTANSILPPGVAFTRGDMRSLHVAAASLVAKVTRDRLMERLDRTFPGFGFAQHKGYGTECHRSAIGAQGPSPVHRRTFLHRLEGPESQSC